MHGPTLGNKNSNPQMTKQSGIPNIMTTGINLKLFSGKWNQLAPTVKAVKVIILLSDSTITAN